MRGVTFATLLWVLPAAVLAADDAAIRAAVQEGLDPAVQRLLPGEERPPEGRRATPTWRKRRIGGDTPLTPARRREEAGGWVLGGAVSTVASVLMWAVIAVGAGLLVAYAARELGGGGARDVAPEPPAAGPRRGEHHAVVEQPLSDADELAREGRFGEAIHTLLLRTLRELAARSRAALPRSLTSREILARVDLGADARAALGDLVTTTELCHFGDEEPGATDYDRCRRQFHLFAAAYQGRTAA
jgi:hypothetical protein